VLLRRKWNFAWTASQMPLAGRSGAVGRSSPAGKKTAGLRCAALQNVVRDFTVVEMGETGAVAVVRGTSTTAGILRAG
jgi:hypothetical protein